MNRTRWRFAAVAAIALSAVVAAPTPSAAAERRPSPEFSRDPGFSVKSQGRQLSPKAVKNLDPMMPCCGDATVCWSTTTTRSRGIWPYGRAVHLYTLWCANGGVINYRDSSAWTSVDWLCGSSNPWWGKVGGGAGWTFVDVQAQAEFTCQSPWWFDWHDFLMQRIRYHGNGYYELIAYQ